MVGYPTAHYVEVNIHESVLWKINPEGSMRYTASTQNRSSPASCSLQLAKASMSLDLFAELLVGGLGNGIVAVLLPGGDIEGGGLGGVEGAALEQSVGDAGATDGLCAEAVVNISLGRVDQTDAVGVVEHDARVVDEVTLGENDTASEDLEGVGLGRDGLPDVVDDVGQRDAGLVLVSDLRSAAGEMVHVVVDECDGVVLA